MKFIFIKTISISIISLLLFVTGCASIVTGQNQMVSVDTSPHKEAICELSNDKGKYFINSTPGSVMVSRSYDDLIVTCYKNDKKGNTFIKSQTKAMAFGNIIAGGVIGAAVDCGTGAAYDYPSVINVSLK